MRKVSVFYNIVFLGSIFLISCTGEGPCGYVPDGLPEKVDIQIERLEAEILSIRDEDQLSNFINKHPLVSEVFFRRAEYPNDSILFGELLARFNNPHMDSLRIEVEQTFKDLSWLENELEEAFTLFRYYYPDIKIPKVQTVATGFDYDMLVTDTLIVVGLDYYMGEGAKYRPQGLYNYILKRYQPEFIVPSIMLIYGISPDRNAYENKDETILAEMVSYGKAFYFCKRMLPCTPDSTLIWYSPDEIVGVKENSAVVWAHFLENSLLWETSHLVKRKYLDERPKTYEIGEDCPPRVATWVGWEIVKKYMDDRPETTLQELMAKKDAKKLFEESRYKPEL